MATASQLSDSNEKIKGNIEEGISVICPTSITSCTLGGTQQTSNSRQSRSLKQTFPLRMRSKPNSKDSTSIIKSKMMDYRYTCDKLNISQMIQREMQDSTGLLSETSSSGVSRDDYQLEPRKTKKVGFKDTEENTKVNSLVTS